MAHPHHHHNQAGLSQANASHFNATAHNYDNVPAARELARRLAAAMLEAMNFDEDVTEAMDFACGTGLISRELAPFTKSLVGVDISAGMVDEYNHRVSNQGIPPEEMRAVCIELQGEEGELDGARFDVIVCALAYHHFSSIEEISRILAGFLKPGGCLLVADIMKGDEWQEVIPEEFHHVVAHTGGLSEAEMRKAFEIAGLNSFTFEKATTAMKHGKHVDFFLAKGVKPDGKGL